ncbi:MAG: OsmC family protein [Polyangiaceae bacterium]
MNKVDVESAQPNEYPQVVKTRSHVFHADVSAASGSTDSAPGPHDYFDSALATCKALTALMFAKKNGIPLERVESHVERDDADERGGVYRLKSRVVFHGPMTDEQRATLHRVVGKCPIHKLMTTSDVQIEALPE